MKNKVLSIIMVLAICICLFAGAFSAIADTTEVIVSVGIYQFEGFTEQSANGDFIGYGIEYMSEISKRSNLVFNYVMYPDWDSCYQAFLNGEVDILPGVVKTPEREEGIVFSQFAMATTALCLYVNEKDNKYLYADHENFGGIKIGVTKNNTRTQRLSRHSSESGFVCKISYFDTDEEMYQALKTGKIDAFLSDRFHVVNNERSIDDFGLVDLNFAITESKPWLKVGIDRAMETIFIRNPYFNQELYNKHYKTVLNMVPTFTSQEQKYISNTTAVNILYNPNLAPVAYLSSDGAAGISNDFIEFALKKISITPKFVSTEKTDTFKLPANDNKKNYIVGGVYNNSSILNAFNLKETDTYMELPVVLIGLSESSPWQSGKTVAVHSQDINMQYFLADKFPHLTPVFIDSVDTAFSAMLTQKSDYIIQYSYIVNDYLQSVEKETVEKLNSTYEFMPISMAVSKTSPTEIVAILDKCIASVSNQDRDTIVLINTIDSPYKLTLSNFFKRNSIVIFVIIATIVSSIIAYIVYTKYKLSKIAYTDPLTGCDNYAKFLKNASLLLERSTNDFAVISIDINNFKIINDTVGRDEGDGILLQLSIALKEKLNPGEILARNTADNFVLIVRYTSNEDMIIRFKHFLSSLQFSSVVSGRTIKTPSISAGVYISQSGETDIYSMVSNANLARKNAKSSHDSSFAFYDREMHQKILQEKKLENSLASALINNEFEVYLQPKYTLSTRTITGAEALIRWNHPVKGMLPPSKFIPVSERTGFILDLDFFVYDCTFKIIDSWIKKGLSPVPVSVNVSRLHLHDPNFVNNFCKIASHYDVPHSLVECELTENLFFEDMNLLNDVVSKFKANGFNVSIDDFGSGYSSLNMLKEVSVDVLKLDREFFSQNADLKREKVVIENIIRMAKELNMQVICEGVETEKQAKFLQSVNCDMAQGYLFARPAPQQVFEEMLMRAQGKSE